MLIVMPPSSSMAFKKALTMSSGKSFDDTFSSKRISFVSSPRSNSPLPSLSNFRKISRGSSPNVAAWSLPCNFRIKSGSKSGRAFLANLAFRSSFAASHSSARSPHLSFWRFGFSSVASAAFFAVASTSA